MHTDKGINLKNLLKILVKIKGIYMYPFQQFICNQNIIFRFLSFILIQI